MNAVQSARDWLASSDATDAYLVADAFARTIIAQHAALAEALDMVERAVHTFVVPGPCAEGNAALARSAFMRRVRELRTHAGAPEGLCSTP